MSPQIAETIHRRMFAQYLLWQGANTGFSMVNEKHLIRTWATQHGFSFLVEVLDDPVKLQLLGANYSGLQKHYRLNMHSVAAHDATAMD